MLRTTIDSFGADERGGGTILGLFWFMLLVGFCGLAVDITDGLRNRTMLQATADSAALAGAIDLPSKSLARSTAVNYSIDNMNTDENGWVLDPNDVHIGAWNADTKSLDRNALLPDAVMVTVYRAFKNNNPVASNFLRIIGLAAWNVRAQAVAQRFIPDCLRDGLIARGIVDISSNNNFVNEICIHGQQGVEMQNHNYYETGVNVSMPDIGTQLTIPSGGMESNPGLPSALRETSLDPRMVNHTDSIMADMLNPNSGVAPNYVNKSQPVIVVDEKFDLGTAQPGRIYHVQCKPNKNARIPNNAMIVNVVIIAECQVSIGSGASIFNSTIGSRSGGNGNITKADVGIAANVQLGAPDDCAPGGGVQLFSNATIHTASSTRINGVQMVAAGDIELGAQDQGINGISAQAGGNIKLTSNNQFGLCSGGAPNLFTVNYYRLVL